MHISGANKDERVLRPRLVYLRVEVLLHDVVGFLFLVDFPNCPKRIPPYFCPVLVSFC